MTHDPIDDNKRETTRRLPTPDKLLRADARLKMVKAADELAAALDKFHMAISLADRRDVAILSMNCPIPCAPWSSQVPNFFFDVGIFSRHVASWSKGLHDDDRFERLGTRRWPESH